MVGRGEWNVDGTGLRVKWGWVLGTGDVSGADEALRAVRGGEGGVAAALLLGQHVDLSLELLGRLD